MRIEDLKVGDELVCVDRDGFLNERRDAEYLLHNKMIVTDVNEHETYLLCEKDEKSCRNYIYSHELKYFKKKEQSQYTFDDLIDVARKAFNDGVIDFYSQDNRGVSVKTKIYGRIFNKHFIEDGIEFIQSLYKETFVIESIEQMNKITFKQDAKITLSNGEVLHESVICSLSKFNNDVAFCVLKGATVEHLL